MNEAQVGEIFNNKMKTLVLLSMGDNRPSNEVFEEVVQALLKSLATITALMLDRKRGQDTLAQGEVAIDILDSLIGVYYKHNKKEIKFPEEGIK